MSKSTTSPTKKSSSKSGSKSNTSTAENESWSTLSKMAKHSTAILLLSLLSSYALIHYTPLSNRLPQSFDAIIKSYIRSDSDSNPASGSGPPGSSSSSSSSSSNASDSETSCNLHPHITSLSSLPYQTVNHPPYTNKKQVYIKKGEIPFLANFAFAKFPKDGDFEKHDHKSLWEIFVGIDLEEKSISKGEYYTTHRSLGSTSSSNTNYTNSSTTLPNTANTLTVFPPFADHAGKNLGDSDWRFLVIGMLTGEDSGNLPEKFKKSKDNLNLEKSNLYDIIHYSNYHDAIPSVPMKTAPFLLSQSEEERNQISLRNQEHPVKRRALIKYGQIPHFITLSEAEITGKIARIQEHIHEDAYEVYLVTSGKGWVKLDGKIRKLKKFDMVFVPPNITHELGAYVEGSESESNPNSEPYMKLLYFMTDVKDKECQKGKRFQG